jgi:hypothetical protein
MNKTKRTTMLPSWLRNAKMLLLTGGLAMTAAACSFGTPEAVPAASEAPAIQTPAGASAQNPAAPSAHKPSVKSPLTGQETAVSDVMRRPVMVMVNNFASARPQSGLSQADILLECLAEGDITRIVAIFQSRMFEEPIGPVRSIRPYFIDIGQSFHALQVHAGGSPDAYTMISEKRIEDLDEITNAGPYFWRESFRKAPHNLYTSLPKLKSGAEKKGYAWVTDNASPAYSFQASSGGAVEAMAGAAAHGPKVDVTFLSKNYVVSYAYDAQRRIYQRSINGAKHIDLNNQEQLTATNLVVLGTDHRVLDSEGRLEVRLTGTGPALVFIRGQVKQVQWKRERTDDLIRLYDGDKEISFQPGQTHMMMVPLKPDFESHVVYSTNN